MDLDRRLMLAGGLAIAAAPAAAAAGPRPQAGPGTARPERGLDPLEFGLVPESSADQTAALQAAIDRAAERGVAVVVPKGRYRCGGLVLRPGSRITSAVPTAAVLELAGDRALLTATGAAGVSIDGLALDGRGLRQSSDEGLVSLSACSEAELSRIAIADAGRHAIALARSGGRISDCTITGSGEAAIFSIDATGLAITGNAIARAANNGILVWRSSPGEDGTLITHNRIERIAAAAGGSGQNGNGINVFRAAGVVVTGNRISDCAYSAIRSNQGSNVHMVANSCHRIGEVALYAEFALEGALIASNLVDGAACGISVTNFNEGGRLAVVQGNILRRLVRREQEPVDKRGEGIAVEADAAVSGNVIDGAETAGIVIGWGRHMRDCAATGNVIRNARVGIAITSDPAAGSCLVANNLISGSREGAIRAMTLGELVGHDLARLPPANPRVVISGNVAT